MDPALPTRLTFRPKSVPLALLVVCLVSFGLLIPLLGFYWDDWPTIWYLHLFGPSGFKEVFAVDRPLLSWAFTLTTAILGENPVAWQVFGFLTRWLCCLALWALLKTIWPQRRELAAWTALLFAVYPGFGQQYIAVTYSHDWLILAGFWISLAAMLWAVHSPRRFWLWMVLSWALAIYTMFADEYYFGLELLRPVLLFWALSEELPEWRRRLRRIVLIWAPYLVFMVAFLVWRIFLHVSPRGQVQVLDRLQQPVAGALDLLKTIAIDLVEAAVLAWGRVVDVATLAGFSWQQVVLVMGVALFTWIAACFYVLRLEPGSQDAPPARRWARQAVFLGALALFVSGWPFWATNLPIELKFPWDRFTLALMFGACLLAAGLIDLLGRGRLPKAILLGLLVGSAAGWHFQQAIVFHHEWDRQKAFFWQLAWRAPAIQPGTALLTAELPFTYYTDNSLTAPLNWIYAPGDRSSGMKYALLDIPVRLQNALPGLQPGLNISLPYRATEFSGSTSRALVLFYNPPRCLKVIDPAVDAGLPNRAEHILEAMPLSDPAGLIQTSPPASLPGEIFGREPDPDWCTYYEKADLARQAGDWQAIVDLGDEGLELSSRLLKDAASELVPFVEGYARTGRWEKAMKLTQQAYKLNVKMRTMLCATWDRIGREAPASPERDAALAEIRPRLQCGTP